MVLYTKSQTVSFFIWSFHIKITVKVNNKCILHNLFPYSSPWIDLNVQHNILIPNYRIAPPLFWFTFIA